MSISVVEAMLAHRFDAYWNSTETYEALKVYIDLNEAGLRDAIVRMMAEASIPIDTTTFQNDMTIFTSAGDVMTLLVHLWYLGYDIDRGEVFIPNNEVRRDYVTATKHGEEWRIISDTLKASDDLLTGYAGEVLLVGVSYDKKTRQHEAVIEEWQQW